MEMILLLCLQITISACIPFWKIDRVPAAYLLGTIHIPSNVIWPYVSNEIRNAFDASTDLYVEIDSVNQGYWRRFLQCLIKRSPRSIDLFDRYLTREAYRANKTVGSLESPEYNCRAEGSRYNLTSWISIIQSMQEPFRSSVNVTLYHQNALVRSYLCDPWNSSRWANMRKSVSHLAERDEHLSKEIHRLLRSNRHRRYFFALGVGHLIGFDQKNVIDRLKHFRYRIEEVKINHFPCEERTTLMHI